MRAPHGGEHFLLVRLHAGPRNGLSHAPLGEPLTQGGTERGGGGDVLRIGTARPEVEHAVSDLSAGTTRSGPPSSRFACSLPSALVRRQGPLGPRALGEAEGDI